MNPNIERVSRLANGERSSTEIAKIVGLSPRYVRRIMKNHGMPRLNEGAQPGGKNHQFVAGRRVDRDGYVLATASDNHPFARRRPGRKSRIMFEHRLVMEQKLGRYLHPKEIVDHVDGLTLHNSPENLRLFATNAEHLKATLTGKVPEWTAAGYLNIGTRSDLGKGYQPVDSYHQHREAGDVRLRQILLAALSLGIDSPYLLGTHRLLEQKHIDGASRPSLERALADLYDRWGAGQTQ